MGAEQAMKCVEAGAPGPTEAGVLHLHETPQFSGGGDGRDDAAGRHGRGPASERLTAQYRAILDTTQDGFAVMDASGRFVEVNDGYCRMIGFSRSEMMEKAIVDVDACESAQQVASHVLRIRNHGWDRFRTRHRARDGRLLEMEVTTAWVPETRQFVCFFRDITENLQLQAQFLQAQKMEAVGQLAGGVAHDFNNILLAMLLQIEILQEVPGADAETRAGLRELKLGTHKAANLTRQLLLFSRKQEAERKPVSLGRIVAGLSKMLRRIMGEHIRLDLQRAEHLPPIHADPGMIEQVVMNLCVNARDAMREGGVLTLRTLVLDIGIDDTVRHPEAREGRFVCLSVGDTGIGMDETTMARIFEPFYTTKGVGKGTGLGLSTVHGIVRQHEGWVEVSSMLGHGTTFNVMLPATEDDVAEDDGPAGDAAPGGSETILLVEDEESVRRMTSHSLERMGYSVVEAAHGREAIDVWQEQAGRFDLLLTDMVMPEGITGIQLASRFREEKPGLPVILCSGHNSEFAFRSAGPPAWVCFLRKPYPMAALARAVRCELDRSPKGPASAADAGSVPVAVTS